jgi:hypothetical protein
MLAKGFLSINNNDTVFHLELDSVWNKNHDYSFIFSKTDPIYLASLLGNPCFLFSG